MGKRSNAYIGAIVDAFDKVAGHLQDFNKQKKEFFEITDENVELVTKRVDILNGKYKGKEKEALKDADYLKLGQQLDRIEPETAKIQTQLERLIKMIEVERDAVETQVDNFEKFVDEKERSTKNPFKKLSVGKSRTFIKNARAALKEIKPSLRL